MIQPLYLCDLRYLSTSRFELLYPSGINLFFTVSTKCFAFLSAICPNVSDIVELLLSYGADVNLSGPDGRSALRAASWAGHEEIVQRLLDAGADVNQQDAEGRSSLIAAAYMGHVGVVEILAQAGADLNHADEDGRTALHVAAFCVRPSETHHEVVSCLLECGANPNVFDCEGITPLLGAARAGNRTVCELCLEADTDVNQADKCGNTALTLAVLGGHTSVVRLLLFWGAAVDSMDPAGRSLLSLAASIGNGPIVQELLARGLDEAHRDHAGCTPLHLASAGRSSATSVNCETEATPEQYSEVIRILLESGAHAEDTDNAGRTPLLTACECNNLAAVEVLLTLSPTSSFNCHSPNHSDTLCSLASVDAPCVPGHPHASFGLTTAAGTPHKAVRKALNQPSLDNQTPLRAAALCNNPDLVRILLAAGADPDYQSLFRSICIPPTPPAPPFLSLPLLLFKDAYGRTTLYLLALEGMLDMADLLLHTPAPGAHQRPGSSGLVGANPVLSDDEGRCPLHVATWQGHLDMVKLLLQAATPVDIRDREGRTPLQLAAWQGHAAICQLLLEEGNARVDAVCSQGATSLCIAAQEGHAHVCSVLLQAGANPFQGDSHGRTPYRVALKAGHVDICKLLEQRYGSNNPIWFDPDGIRGCEPVTPEMHPHHGTNDRVHGPFGPGLGTRVHPRSTGQDVPRGAEENPNQVLSSAQPPSILDGSHFHPLPRQHQHNHHVPVRRDYGDDANPYARPPGPMAVHGFQQPSSDNSSYSETPNGHPSMCIQPRSHMNSSGNPTSYLYSDSFAQTDFGHPHPNHSGQWQYNTPAAYAPISELRTGVFIPITNYSRQVEPPTYDPVHPGAFHLPLERTTSQALHFQPNSFGQQIPTQLVGQQVDTSEALPIRVSPAVVNSETRNLPIQQPLDPDSRIAIDSQWTKPSQPQHQPHHHHHHHHYPHPKGAAVPHHSLRNEVRDADIDPRERLVVQTTKFQNPVGEVPRPSHSRLLQESPKYPDLLTNPFNQVHLDRGRGDKTASAASAVSPHNASAVMKTTKISASALSVNSSVRDHSQTPRHRNEPLQPPLVPQHVTGATTSSTNTTTVTTSVSLAPQSESKKFQEDRLVLREVPVQASPNPASRQESKTSTAKSTLAGMLLFGNRKGKKSRKQPSDSPEMVTQLSPGSFLSGGNGIPGVPLRTKLKPTSQPRTGRPKTAGDDPKVDRLPYVNQSDRPACLEGHRIKTSPTTATPSGHDFPDRGVTSSMQLEALARKFACCTQIEGVPSSNAAFVSRSQMTPSKPYSPQLWDRQSLRNDSSRQQM
ncbi:Ankyrin repeat domain-containing protein 50 [Fasciola gigantica]|uniref:Ankyrin repeat domain-containing protein 50 n=1 Tax=Fasciola gigantica TaxID=46835 RepID=A0A504YLB4_FASGI|nr:Ankyrin repeat domain-containing protein 50 [Fasciola gigantica]